MKKMMIALISVGLVYGLAAAQQQYGGEGSRNDAKSTMGTGGMNNMEGRKSGKMNMFKGTVDSVDVAGSKLTVTDHKGTSMVVPVGSGSKIMKNGKTASLSEIEAGEMVHIKYEGDMNNPTVKSIKVEKDHGHKKKMEKMGNKGMNTK